jgi:hypothetical protein
MRPSRKPRCKASTSANADGISQERKDTFCESERVTVLRSLRVYFRILEGNRDAFDRLRQTPSVCFSGASEPYFAW